MCESFHRVAIDVRRQLEPLPVLLANRRRPCRNVGGQKSIIVKTHRIERTQFRVGVVSYSNELS